MSKEPRQGAAQITWKMKPDFCNITKDSLKAFSTFPLCLNLWELIIFYCTLDISEGKKNHFNSPQHKLSSSMNLIYRSVQGQKSDFLSSKPVWVGAKELLCSSELGNPWISRAVIVPRLVLDNSKENSGNLSTNGIKIWIYGASRGAFFHLMPGRAEISRQFWDFRLFLFVFPELPLVGEASLASLPEPFPALLPPIFLKMNSQI